MYIYGESFLFFNSVPYLVEYIFKYIEKLISY